MIIKHSIPKRVLQSSKPAVELGVYVTEGVPVFI